MWTLLNLLPFAISLGLMSIGWHDHQFPATAFAPNWKWWFMIGGFFFYMAAWNGWDRYRRETRDPLARRGVIYMWWFDLRLSWPGVGFLVPLLKLYVMAIAVDWIARYIERQRH